MTFAEKLAAQMAAKNIPQTQQTSTPTSQSQQLGSSQTPQPSAGFTSSETSLPAGYSSLQQPQGSPTIPQQWPRTQYAQQWPGDSPFQQQQPQGLQAIPQQRPGTQYAQQQPGSSHFQQQQPQIGYPYQQQMNVMQQQQQSAETYSPEPTNMYKQILQSTICARKLQAFFPPNDTRLDQAAAVAAKHIDQVCIDWDLPKEMGHDLVQLALYDVVVYIDNSYSMKIVGEGKRIEDLRSVLNYVVGIVKLFDSDGLSIRFMNHPSKALDHVKDENTINAVLQPDLFHSDTPIGTQLRKQIVNDIAGKAEADILPKPVLVITITDGQPEGEPEDTLRQTILHAKERISQTIYGEGAVSFEIAQVGNDKYAQAFLDRLDNDPKVGHLVDCTSNHEQEDAQMRRTTG